MNRDAQLAERYYGTSQAVPAAQRLTAGPWSVLFVDGALRDIRHGGIEIIRSIAYLVRDRDWGTCVPELSGLVVGEQEGAFRIAYEAKCENPEGHVLGYRISIECRSESELGSESEIRGSLRVHAVCTARTGFVTARCGFCVLHPIDGVAGAVARVEHGDGSVEDAHFPEMIDPWQPFMDIRSIEHRLAHGLTVRCELLGDTFEMEDQRNWSDASFKTYSRPLALPWPYTLAAGEVTAQTVRVSVGMDGAAGAVDSPGTGTLNASQPDNDGPDHASRGEGRVLAGRFPAQRTHAQGVASAANPDKSDATIISLLPSLGPVKTRLPALGLAVAPAEVDAVLKNFERLVELAPQRLLLHFDPVAGHGLVELQYFASLVRRSGLPATLECALPGVGAPEVELAAIAALVDEAALPLTGIVVSPSVHRQSNPPGSISPPCPPLDEVYRAARRVFPALRLGGGMLSYFTELNRKRPPLELVDVVTHATCPIVHAADDRSVMETLEAVPHITRSCRALIGSRPYVIGPVSIGMRQNPYGSRVMPNPERERIAMAGDDPRQRGLFGAAWLAGYAAALADTDLECLTVGALTGPRGLISDDGQRYPIYAIAAVLARLAGAERVACRSTRGNTVTAFAGRRASGATTVVLANLSAGEQRCLLELSELGPRTGAPYSNGHDTDNAARAVTAREVRQARIAMIDEQSFMSVRGGVTLWSGFELADVSLTLKPFACAVMEWEDQE